jgi:hypothetical protein
MINPNIDKCRWVGEINERIKSERERYEPMLGGYH